MLKRTWRKGKTAEELTVGEKLHLTETIEDKDLLLYLGLTNDNNPLYIQHDYTAETPYEKPIVPSIMLNGIITSAISKYLPGPGSRILEQHLTYAHPVYHYETVDFSLQIAKIDTVLHTVLIEVEAINADNLSVVAGHLIVQPPH